jgi:hypothetical protein
MGLLQRTGISFLWRSAMIAEVSDGDIVNTIQTSDATLANYFYEKPRINGSDKARASTLSEHRRLGTAIASSIKIP